MDDSGYYTTGLGDFEVCSPQDSARHIFNLKFSDLPASQYNCFLHGFKDEQDFEAFKQDLRDFQKLKRGFVCRFIDGGDDGGEELIDLAELQFICKNNYLCKSRRGCASRSARPCNGAPLVPEVAPLRSPPTVVQAGLSTADTPSVSKYKAPLKDGSQQALNNLLAVERPGSLCRTSHVGVAASSVGCDRSDDLELSISDILMEFLNEDEHFLEFEQVFEAVRNRRISRDLDTRHMSHLDTGRRISSNLDTGRRISSNLDTGRRISSITDTGPYTKLDSSTGDNSPKDVQQPNLACDIFTDFFDNDESFLEFEKEFERFRSGRRSCLLENRHDLSWTDGVFGDPNVCCGQEASSYTSYSPCCSQNETDPHKPFVYSAKDWTKMIRKIRRSSCISVNYGTDRRLFQHRYSVGELSEDCKRKEERYKADPVSDFMRFHKHEPSPNSSQELTSLGESRLNEQVIASSDIQLRRFHKHQPSPNSSQELTSLGESRLNEQVIASSDIQLRRFHKHQPSPNSSQELTSLGESRLNEQVIASSDIQLRRFHKHQPSPNSSQELTSLGESRLNEQVIASSDIQLRRFHKHQPSPNSSQELTSLGESRLNEQVIASSDIQLRRFHKHDPSPNSSQELISLGESRLMEQVTDSSNIQPSSQNQQDLLTPEADLWLQSSVTPTRDEPGLADSCHNGHDSSTGQSSAISEDHSRPSSPSHCCSSSCFCQSDLFIEEAGDKPQITSDPPHSRRVRSFSLMNLGSQAPVTDFRPHTNSLENLNYFKRCHRSGSPLAGSLLQRLSHSNAKYFGDGDLDDSLSSSTPSVSCSHLSCADSEHYHTATSDLSGGYSTAKSNLSLLIDRLESAVIDQRERFGSSEEPALNCDCISDYTFDPANTSEPGSITGDQYNSCRQRDDWPAGRDKRPGSSSACQYTCHEHCVPSVTLSCKSVSGDGCDIAAARISSPPDPRSHGDSCFFMGNIQARPGAARIVSGSTADTPTMPTARTSESVPNFQHLSPGRRGAGHMDTPRPFNIPSHHRSWSISEDIVTPHSGLIQHPGVISDPARRSPAPHTSSPHRQPAYSDSHFDSFPHGNTCRQSQLHADAPRAESHCVGEGGVLSQHSKGGDGPAGDTPALDLPDVYRRDEDTNAATEKDETDSGYRSGTIPDDKLPRVASQATLDQQELQSKVTKFNHFVPAACLEVTGKESFQGFMKVTMNLIRPITMELGARPPSIYELLTREHIVEENTQHVAFYMPRDTHKSLHITSDTTTKEVIASLLKKFHILDHPRKFAMYEQEFSDRNKLVRLRRLTDKDCPLRSMVNWDPERIKNYRMVLQENETGEIVWDAFSLPELNNFLRVLDREEKETVKDLKHKYAYMKQYMDRRMSELRGESTKKTKTPT